jgi:hypothetical protein
MLGLVSVDLRAAADVLVLDASGIKLQGSNQTGH